MKQGTAKGWVVADRDGVPLVQTTCKRRKDAILVYGGYYANDRRVHGVRVVRCTITTHPKEES